MGAIDHKCRDPRTEQVSKNDSTISQTSNHQAQTKPKRSQCLLTRLPRARRLFVFQSSTLSATIFGSSRSLSRSNSTISSRLSTVRKKILSPEPKNHSKALRKDKSKVSKLGGIVIPKRMKHSCGQSKGRPPNLKFSVLTMPSTSGKVSRIRTVSSPS